MGLVSYFKGIELLIRTFKRIKNKNIFLNLYGPTNYRKEDLKRLLQEDERIFYFGPFDYKNLIKILKTVDIVVVPSLTEETYSLVVQEALMAKIPILAARIGAIPERIKHGINGFLFKPGEQQDFLIKLSFLINNYKKIKNSLNYSLGQYTLKEEIWLVAPFYYCSTNKIPSWTKIKKGPLKDFSLFLNSKSVSYWRQMIYGSYDSFIYDYIKSKLRNKPLVFWDIGSHFGYHTLAMAALKKENRIFSFEPNIYNYARLKINLEFNKKLKKRIHIFNLALGDEDKNAFLKISSLVDASFSSGSYLERVTPPEKEEIYQNFKKIKVEMRKADTLIGKKVAFPPDLVKIDTEGAEFLVLMGFKRTIKKYKPIFLIEIHSLVNFEKIKKFFSFFGYKINIIEKLNGYQRFFISAETLKK